MKIRTLGCLVALAATASSFISCKQASVACVVGHAGSSSYVAQFYPASPPACAAMTDSVVYGTTLDKVTFDEIGMETYHPQKTDADGVAPDFSKGTVAIQSASLGNTAGSRDPDPAMDHKVYAIGDWTAAEPDPTTDFCPVQDIKPAEQDFPAIPADPMDPMSMPVPAANVKYEWKNVQIYVTAAAQGTQFSADLTYTENSCSVDYHVRGLWPEIPCGVEVPDPMDPTGMNTITVPQDDLCCPNSCPPGKCGDMTKKDPNYTRTIGSGINPDYPVKCDHDLMVCVFDAPPEAKLPIIGAKANEALCGTAE